MNLFPHPWNRIIACLIATFSLAAPLLAQAAQADRTAEISAQLKFFGANPAALMKQIPVKHDAVTGKVVSRSAFSADSITSRDFVLQKDEVRKQLCTIQDGAQVCLGDEIPGRAPYEANDLAENLVDNGAQMVRSLETMDSEKLTEAKLAESPWSDDYWPIYEGILGQRYADPNFPKAESWAVNHDYATAAGTNFVAIVHEANSSSMDDLSPSEKYDLLVGDVKGTLTAKMWGEGQTYLRETGKVETWMGICHGWSPASYMIGRPEHTVELTAADGKTKLTFYPSDIKALASLLWANAKVTTRMIGNRCALKDPATDANGRTLVKECFDTNPGTWHMAVVNQLGIAKRSMVIDATFDYEVWNQPLYSYTYSYFNPQTLAPAADLAAAKVAFKDFSSDKFKTYRSKDAVTAVGIAMDLTYIEETTPSHAVTDSQDQDHPTTVRYMYDVELNDKGEIIGGEWYENAHPDFIWTPGPKARARSPGDHLATGGWNGHGALPAAWAKAAIATSKSKMPLAKIVELLSSLARL